MNKHLLLLVSSMFMMSFIFNGCSKKSEQEYWDLGHKFEKEGKFAEAIDSFESLVSNYPSSPKASAVLFEIGKLYQSKSVKNISNTDALKKSISYYEKISDDYPNSPEAPSALFMVGFIYANDLRDFNSATQALKKFLAKYPKHEMASSAQAELDNMGLTPDEILKKNLEAKQ